MRSIPFILFCLLLTMALQADEGTKQQTLSADHLKQIQEKTLSLLRELAPTGSSGRPRQTMELDGAMVYWGNLFDPDEVVALVDLPPQRPQADDDESAHFSGDCWPCYLSLCAWVKDHWVYRQYVDNAHTISFHDRRESPRHFVQATRQTARYDGDYLSWFYDPKTRMLLRTNYENWGPFFLVGNYLCTTRGYERREMEDTVWIYPYSQGRKGNLLAAYSMDFGRSFSITFRDFQTKKLWTYTFLAEEQDQPFLNFSVDAVEEDFLGKVESPIPSLRYTAEITLSRKADLDRFFFERLTRLSSAWMDLAHSAGTEWTDVEPSAPPIQPVDFKISGDSEIVRHLKNP